MNHFINNYNAGRQTKNIVAKTMLWSPETLHFPFINFVINNCFAACRLSIVPDSNLFPLSCHPAPSTRTQPSVVYARRSEIRHLFHCCFSFSAYSFVCCFSRVFLVSLLLYFVIPSLSRSTHKCHIYITWILRNLTISFSHMRIIIGKLLTAAGSF